MYLKVSMDYSLLTKVYSSLERTSKRLEKTAILAKFFKGLKNFDKVVLLVRGRVFPETDERKIGMSEKLVMRSIALAVGVSVNDVNNLFKVKGDLGDVAHDLIKVKKQRTLFSSKLSVSKVFENIRKLSSLEGAGSIDRKVKLVAELLTSATPLEARYIVKTVVEQMRVGVASGIVRDAIASAFDSDVKDVEKAYNVLVDYAKVASLAKKGKLSSVKLGIGNPVKVMLAIIAKDVPDAFSSVGSPALFQYKYDGFRMEIHRKGSSIKLFTRRMDDVTKQFPDVVDIVLKNIKGDNYIIDCEAVGLGSKGEYLPFQSISQRIKRKHGIDFIAKKFPVELNVFDVLAYNGKNLMDVELLNRHKLLKKLIKEKKGKILIAKSLITSNVSKANKFYKKAIADGFEGLIVKNLNSLYKPGRYVGGWVKLKEILEPLDLVIVGAEYGHGKRSGSLSSFILACKKGNKFLECGKLGTGFKEKGSGVTFFQMTKMLKPLIVSEKESVVSVKPKIVIEVGYEEIQKSSKYSSGYALRFPRLLRLRIDEKKSSDINSLKDLERIYKIQKGKIK